MSNAVLYTVDATGKPVPVGAGSPLVPANVDVGALITHAAAGAGVVNGADQTNLNGSGIKVVVDITGITGTAPSLTVAIQGKDTASGKYYNLLTSAALTANGTYVLTVYAGLVAAANVAVNDVLPRTWRIVSTIAGTAPVVTATVGAVVIA